MAMWDLTTADRDGPYRLGGTVTFAAFTASRLGLRATVLTAADKGVDLAALRAVADVHVLPSEHTTTFSNVYTPAGRTQYCYTPAARITTADISAALRSARAVLLGPIADEIDPDVAAAFSPTTLVAAIPQGWMRRLRPTGEVHHEPWASSDTILPHLRLLVLSLEDIDFDLRRIHPFFAHLDLVVVTEWRDGSTIYQRQPDGAVTSVHVAPRPAAEVDPTGAGDVFATAFLVRWLADRDPVAAAGFANVVASISVEAPGATGVPTLAEAEAYLADHPLPMAPASPLFR